MDQYTTPARLTTTGSVLQSLIAQLRRIKPVYDQLRFVASYSSPNLAGRFVSAIQDMSGQHPTDLRIQVGQFALGTSPYLWLVNRHTLATDNLDLNVTLNLPAGQTFAVTDVFTGSILARVSQSNSSFRLLLGPGSGKLLALR